MNYVKLAFMDFFSWKTFRNILTFSILFFSLFVLVFFGPVFDGESLFGIMVDSSAEVILNYFSFFNGDFIKGTISVLSFVLVFGVISLLTSMLLILLIPIAAEDFSNVVHKRHYSNKTIDGFDVPFSKNVSSSLKAGIYSFFASPFLMIPFLGVVISGYPLFKETTNTFISDTGSKIVNEDEFNQILNNNKGTLFLLKLIAFGISVIPFINIIGSVFNVMMFSHFFFDKKK